MKITTTTGSYYGDSTDNHIYRMMDDGEMVGELYIDTTYLVVMNVEVIKARRGEGIARQLFEAAEAALGTVYHAPEWGCTPEGNAFAEAMGGERLDDETMAALTGTSLDDIIAA